MSTVSDLEYQKHGGYGYMFVETRFNGEPITVTVAQYEEDATYGYEYQAFWHPVDLAEFDKPK